jgi:hypothetical protein
MELHRLTPTSLAKARVASWGRCAACEKALKRNDEVVHLYGEAFHHDCAFYRRAWARPA